MNIALTILSLIFLIINTIITINLEKNIQNYSLLILLYILNFGLFLYTKKGAIIKKTIIESLKEIKKLNLPRKKNVLNITILSISIVVFMTIFITITNTFLRNFMY